MRILVLLHEAFGGRGGIAKFNRDLVTSLCSHPGVSKVVALPRQVTDPVGAVPRKLHYPTGSLDGKSSYLLRLLLAGLTRPHFDMIICGHVNLLPLAFAVQPLHGCPLGLVVHGIEAWHPTGRSLTDRLVNRIDFFISVSACTKSRFLAWTDLDAARGFILPNTVDTAYFTPGPVNSIVARRWGIEGKRVVSTLARLEARERYKGIDEILQVLPALLAEFPDLAYVVAGDGSDRPRLEAKARSLGIADHVVFSGYISEDEKRDLYRLSHVFAMPSHGEGFGIVFLEAMACGVPVVASAADGSREAVRDGALGLMVNPADPADVRAGIRAALGRPRGVVPQGLAYFDMEHFERRLHTIIDRLASPTVSSVAVPRT